MSKSEVWRGRTLREGKFYSCHELSISDKYNSTHERNYSSLIFIMCYDHENQNHEINIFVFFNISRVYRIRGYKSLHVLLHFFSFFF